MQADVFSLVFECVQDGRFWPGTTGSEWTKPEGFDQKRIEKETGTRARAQTQTRTSWRTLFHTRTPLHQHADHTAWDEKRLCDENITYITHTHTHVFSSPMQ